MVKIFMKCLKLKELIFEKKILVFIFQNFNLLDTLTVKENIILPLKLAGKIIDEEDFKQIIKDLEIDDLLDKYPFECSGGQSQRVAVARTLVMHQRLFLLMNLQVI